MRFLFCFLIPCKDSALGHFDAEMPACNLHLLIFQKCLLKMFAKQFRTLVRTADTHWLFKIEERCHRDPAKVRVWRGPEAGTEVPFENCTWVSPDRGPGPAPLGCPREAEDRVGADRTAGTTKLLLALRIVPCHHPTREGARGLLLWSCHWGWAWLQGHMVVITRPLKLVTLPET